MKRNLKHRDERTAASSTSKIGFTIVILDHIRHANMLENNSSCGIWTCIYIKGRGETQEGT